ncbi:MAG: nuclear transport factor 2 family protein [Myxococcota bacterium]
MSKEATRETVERMWAALGRMDWAEMKSCLHPEIFYQDVPTDDPGARGPENVEKRLRIAFDHLERQDQVLHHLAIDGDVVFLDHTETWTFKTGETAAHKFVTLHEMRDGKISLWSDYWDVNKFVSQYPQWFLEVMAKHSASDFGN